MDVPPAPSPPRRARSPLSVAKGYAGILLVLLVTGVILLIPFAYTALFPAVQDADKPLSAFRFTDRAFRPHDSSELAGSVVVLHFFYAKENSTTPSSSTPVDFTPGTKKQLDALAPLASNFSAPRARMDESVCKGDGCVNVLTVIVPRVCCTNRSVERFFAGPGDPPSYFNYDIAKVTWFIVRDSQYEAYKAAGRYVQTTTVKFPVVEDPLKGDQDSVTLVLDKRFKVRYNWSFEVSTEQIEARVKSLLSEPLSVDRPAVVPEPVNLAAIYALLVLAGAVSLLSPCCLGIAIASVGSIISIQREAGASLRRSDSALIGFSFSLGMGLVFFGLGLGFVVGISGLGIAAGLAGVILQGSMFLIGTSIALIILGLMAFGVHHPLRDRYNAWKYERAERKAAAAGKHDHGGAPGEMGPDCPHCKAAKERTEANRETAARRAGVASFVSGAVFGVVGIPCAIIFVLPALAIVAAQNVPMLVGGALLFVFGFARGIMTVPLAVGAGAVQKSQGKLQKFIIKHRKHLNWAFGASLLAFAAYLLVRLFYYYQ